MRLHPLGLLVTYETGTGVFPTAGKHSVRMVEAIPSAHPIIDLKYRSIQLYFSPTFFRPLLRRFIHNVKHSTLMHPFFCYNFHFNHGEQRLVVTSWAALPMSSIPAATSLIPRQQNLLQRT